MSNARVPNRRFSQMGRMAGFTLVEALVALVILSIGMLGIAALYVEGLRASRTALIRTEAVNLASDMADRIRINRDGGSAYEGAAATAPNSACLPGGAGCTPQEMAAHDLRVWLDNIAATLPGGNGTIDWTDAVPTDDFAVYVVTINWSEAGQGQLSYSLRVET